MSQKISGNDNEQTTNLHPASMLFAQGDQLCVQSAFRQVQVFVSAALCVDEDWHQQMLLIDEERTQKVLVTRKVQECPQLD